MVVTVDVKHVYKYPFELVAQTHFNKYPSEKEKFVQSIETLEKKVDHRSDTEYRLRVATCVNVIPWILRKVNILNEEKVFLEERSWFDGRNRQLCLRSRCLSWTKYACIWEESKFKASEENPKWTVLEQHGEIDITGIGPFGKVVEVFAQQFLNSGVKRGLNIMEELLKENSHKSKHISHTDPYKHDNTSLLM